MPPDAATDQAAIAAARWPGLPVAIDLPDERVSRLALALSAPRPWQRVTDPAKARAYCRGEAQRRLLGKVEADLAAAGVMVERRREAGTGRRVVTLRPLSLPPECGMAARGIKAGPGTAPAETVESVTVAKAGKPERTVTLHVTLHDGAAGDAGLVTTAGGSWPECRCERGLLWHLALRRGRRCPECDKRYDEGAAGYAQTVPSDAPKPGPVSQPRRKLPLSLWKEMVGAVGFEPTTR